MNNTQDKKSKSRKGTHAAALAELAHQGQQWKFAEEVTRFKRPAALFDQPMEITLAMLRGLRMVDETIVVHGKMKPSDNSEEES